MAARLSPYQDERSRLAIQTTQLVKRLQGFALGAPDPQSPSQAIRMSRDQVAAALGLLKKTLPDLLSTTLEASSGTGLGFVIYGAKEAETVDEWAAANPPPA